MRTILSVIGARPQFIKHAPVQLQLQKQCRALTLHTGQHYDANMSQVFFEELGIPAPDFLLDIAGAKAQGAQTGLMMMEIERVCSEVQPDAMLIYGDTNSTLAGALVAAKMHIPIIHVEAGIRSYNREMPEEVNRIIADTFAAILFCPIPQAVDNLRREGIAHSGIHVIGDVMCDMLELVRPRIQPPAEGQYYFCTIHRPYNTDEPERMRRILSTLNGLEHPVYFPIHPRTVARLAGAGIDTAAFPNIRFIEPVGYLASISYQAGADCIITDSGGIQKEAYMLRKKCITLRSETEWGETLRHGWNTLLFEDVERVPEVLAQMPGEYVEGMFGDGRAAEAIAGIIRDYFAGQKPGRTRDSGG